MQQTADAEHQTPELELRDNQGISKPSMYGIGTCLHLLLIALAGLFIYTFHLGSSPLDRTEPFRALVADRMAKGGNWLIPHLYGEPYLRKPPLIYWIEAIVQKIAGHGNEFIWRLPSAVGSALLAVFVAGWAGRWFGPRALLPAGFSCLALVALWDQDRGADIDALNTACAIVTTACLLELLYGSGKRTLAWCGGFGIALGATLLLKGPGGLPQVFAAMIGPAILLRDWKPLRRRGILIATGFLVGFAMFAAYVIAGKIEMRRLGIIPDHTGWYEAISKTFLHSGMTRLKAIGIPFALIAYALPVSAVLPFAIDAIRRMAPTQVHRRQAVALSGTLVASIVIWVLGGNDNPRYEYVMLPLLAPLVGFVWADRGKNMAWFEGTLIGICILICEASLIVTSKLPANDPARPLCVIAALLGAVVTIWVIFGNPTSKKRWLPVPVAMVILLMLLSIPMGANKNAERRRKSARAAGAQLREVIGDSQIVSAAGVVRDMPELFYYAGVDVDSYGEFGLPQLVANRHGRWVVVSENERYPAYSTITKRIPGSLTRITKLNMPDSRDQIYVGWYEPLANADTRIEIRTGKVDESDD